MVVGVVVVVDSLELELDDEYPEGDDGGGVWLFDDDFERVRSALRSISRRLGLGNGVGGRSSIFDRFKLIGGLSRVFLPESGIRGGHEVRSESIVSSIS